MKKIFITILISLSIGSIFAFIMFKNVNKEVELVLKDTQTVNFFQVGVFKNAENADTFMQNYNSSIIIKDKDYYRVIIGITKSEEATLKLKNYFTSLNIDYYVKQENINDNNFLLKLQEYEELLIKSNEETYNTINQNILKLYEGKQS